MELSIFKADLFSLLKINISLLELNSKAFNLVYMPKTLKDANLWMKVIFTYLLIDCIIVRKQ